MKTLLAPALLAVAALLLGTTLLLTCAEPTSVPLGFNLAAVDQNPGPSTPAPVGLYQQPTPCLPAGIHPADPQSFESLLPGSNVLLPKPTPLDLDNPPTSPAPLQPGVYQTYPYTIIVVVPGVGSNGRDFVVKPNTNSPMPIVKPRVEIIPKS